jgi:hypothetical protein
MPLIFLLLSLCLIGCDHESPPISSFQWRTISGRTEAREPIYRIKAPIDWTRHDPLFEESLADTTKPLCEFYVKEGDEVIKISIHNFPSDHITQRIPPLAQIARWERQFQQLCPEETHIAPQGYNGFSGAFFQGTGIMNGTLMTVLGWAMQIAPEHYHTLSYPETSQEALLYPQMRADFTIKVVGPKDLVHKQMHSLIAFARSFELIDEVPHRS